MDSQIKAQIMSESKEDGSYLDNGEPRSVAARRESSEGTMVEEVGAVRLAMRVQKAIGEATAHGNLDRSVDLPLAEGRHGHQFG